MATEEVRFAGPAFKRATTEADGKRHPSRAPLILVDRRYEGVTIRVTGKSAAWYLRYKKVFHRLAPVGYDPNLLVEDREKGVIYTADVADELAGNVREIIDRGFDPKAYIAAWAEHGDYEKAAAAAGSVAAKGAGAWDWEKLVERFLRDHIAQDKHLGHAVKPASGRTYKEVVDILRDPDLDHIKTKLVRDLSRTDFEPIRDRWFEADRKNRQKKLITYTKSALSWAKENFSESGLDDVTSWWRDMRHRSFSTKAAVAKSRGEKLPRTLTPADVAMLLFLAERNRSLPDNENPGRTGETTLAYLWWVCLTAQRTHAAAAVQMSMVRDRVREDGWYEVSWLPSEVKSRRFHVLPISPEIYRRTIGRALAAPNRRENTIWAFPANRVIKLEKGDPDRPVGDYILNNLLARLRGARTDGPDMLAGAGLPHFSPHTVRKALTTFLSDQPLPAGTASAILDHAAKKTETEEEAAVTARHYNASLRLPLKNAGLVAWSTAVITEYENLVARERTRRYGLTSGEGAGRRQALARAKDEDAWLFNEHLPKTAADAANAADVVDFTLLRKASAPRPEADDDRMDEVG